MSINIFEAATRRKLLFQSATGLLTIEQVWDLPLVGHARGTDLNTIAVSVSKKLGELGEQSFVETAKPDPRKRDLQLQLDILKHVIDVKQAEAKRLKSRAERDAEYRKLAEVLANKQEAKLATMSEDDILKRMRKIADAEDEATDEAA